MTNIIFILSALIFQSLADVLQCDVYFGFNIPTNCRITTGSVADGEILQISNNNQSIALLTFSNVNFNSIPKNIFVNYPNIKTFYVTDNNLNQLISDDFKNAQKLTTIFIYKNQLKVLNANAFQFCSSLTDLEISTNPITNIVQNAFAGLSNLQQLLLTDLPLSNFNSIVLSDLPALQSLEMRNCSLTIIDKNFFVANKNLSTIDLENNNIDTIENGAFDNLLNIQTLLLNFNQLTTVSTYNAKSFSAEYNLLKSFHIGSLSEGITVQNNFIFSFSCDKTLNVLSFDASNNSISKIPCVAKMVNAFTIDLSSNNIGKVRKTIFANLNKTLTLDIHNNPNMKIGSKILISMTNLRSLSVDFLVNGYKNLKEIHPKLETIYISTEQWTCAHLTKVANTLNDQKIYLDYNNKTLDFFNFKCQLDNFDVSHFNTTR
ncbi:hypothetical protein PVAND_013805 [Polypedilum vanderplanki]|uniref:Uncharacterized protein n=1 Tax=Polypedilum vanderplanki TaxID=319348 RepID=A0A9J6CRQ9_POLVA|nr:hypothetical protein PVAND_013805 [Polypedilum vanderplanki]